MVKQLRKVGNSNAIVLDKPLMELVGLEPGGKVNVQVNGTMICLTPVTPEYAPPEAYKEALDDVMKNRKSMLKRLAQ